ncbi:MAG: amidohydrolase [Proteobacteria bacterium]|nr:amidohydrolase [Pseudomonadota bacterium]
MKEKLVHIRRTLHQHPELGFQEHWTSDFLAEHLCALGLEVHRGIAETGIVALAKGKDPELPAIGYRADMDALPISEKTGLPFASTNGCMHACGHDGHMTVALGVAEKIASAPLSHTVAFVFQPNEEGAPGEKPTGADAMCQTGFLETFNISRMVALHTDPTLQTGLMGICDGCLWAASGRFVIHIQGDASHAAYPERGHDAMLAAAALVQAVYLAKARQRKIDMEVISFCQLTAGHAFNVIAPSADLEGIIRAPSRKNLDQMADLIRNCAAAIDLQFGTHTTVERFYGALPVINDHDLTTIARNCWKDVGIEVKMNLASEDFSYFSERIPSFFAMMGIRPKDRDAIPPSHAEDFFLDEEALLPAVEAMDMLLRALDKT